VTTNEKDAPVFEGTAPKTNDLKAMSNSLSLVVGIKF
jgi:hypothetical protein